MAATENKELACSKCGKRKVSTWYHASRSDCLWAQRLDHPDESEHLHYTCCNCGFTWTGRILSKKEPNG